MKKHLINSLRLVFPPVSNQEADWLWGDAEVREFVKHSKLYFIGQRKEIFFENFKMQGRPIAGDPEGTDWSINFEVKEDIIICTIGFDIVGEEHKETNLKLYLPICSEEFDEQSLNFDFGPKIIRISSSDGKKVYGWWTPDKLIFDHWRSFVKVEGIKDYKKFTKFNLHYVGISKEDDSFTRLFDTGHKNRTKILSNESQLKETARLTDELMIFFFDVEDIGIRTMDFSAADEEIEEFTKGLIQPKGVDKIKLIADAEKAFVSLLNCKYNTIKYKNYPKSVDGLYSEKLTRYGYLINEDLTFITPTTEFVGDLHPITGLAGPKADLIIIEGKNVQFIKSDK